MDGGWSVTRTVPPGGGAGPSGAPSPNAPYRHRVCFRDATCMVCNAFPLTCQFSYACDMCGLSLCVRCSNVLEKKVTMFAPCYCSATVCVHCTTTEGCRFCNTLYTRKGQRLRRLTLKLWGKRKIYDALFSKSKATLLVEERSPGDGEACLHAADPLPSIPTNITLPPSAAGAVGDLTPTGDSTLSLAAELLQARDRGQTALGGTQAPIKGHVPCTCGRSHPSSALPPDILSALTPDKRPPVGKVSPDYDATPPGGDAALKCHFCHSVESALSKKPFKFCTRCKSAVYCNVVCQRRHYAAHKSACKAAAASKPR